MSTGSGSYDWLSILAASKRSKWRERHRPAVNSIAEMTIDGREKIHFDKNHEPVLEMLVQDGSFPGNLLIASVENIGRQDPDLGAAG